MERILIVGGDGFIGWPLSLYLSKRGFCVTIVDNLLRRKIDFEIKAESLTPIAGVYERVKAWNDLDSPKLKFKLLDVSRNYVGFSDIIKSIKPSVIIHLGEVRSAPYSMIDEVHRRVTVENNISTTHNILNAIVESGEDIHLVHIGTAGVYGYSSHGIRLPEGYITVKIEKDGQLYDWEIVYPPNPGSIYHMTKCLDAQLFQYYNKTFGLKITDLHQGIVWGTQTEETKQDEALINRFDYDGDYGTVLNRFIVQAAVGYPLTVHGKGLQKRGFIHITDSMKCLLLAINNPPSAGERVRIINQVTEEARVIDLAEKVARLTGCQIGFCHNPRLEAEENELEISNQTLLDLGLEPTFLAEGLIEEIFEVAGKYKERCKKDRIMAQSSWVKGMRTGWVKNES